MDDLMGTLSFCGVTAAHGHPEHARPSRGCHHHSWNALHTALLCSHPLVGLRKHSASIRECQWVLFFSCVAEFSDAPSFRLHFQVMHFSDRPPQQQNTAENWWEGTASTATPPRCTSDVVGQQNNVGGVTFGEASHMMALLCSLTIKTIKKEVFEKSLKYTLSISNIFSHFLAKHSTWQISIPGVT